MGRTRGEESKKRVGERQGKQEKRTYKRTTKPTNIRESFKKCGGICRSLSNIDAKKQF